MEISEVTSSQVAKRCTATTSKGQPCRQFAISGTDKCFYHSGKEDPSNFGARSKLMNTIYGSNILGFMPCSQCRDKCRYADENQTCFYEKAIFNRFKDYFSNLKDMDFADFALFMGSAMLFVQMVRAQRNSALRGTHTDLSRMLDALNRSLRELKLTRSTRDTLEQSTQMDIMTFIANYYKSKQTDTNKNKQEERKNEVEEKNKTN